MNALDKLTRLVDKSTSEELKIYDKILRDRIEFSFLNGVNSAYQNVPDMTGANLQERQKFDDEFLKRGLPWMMALARIELAATASAYGDLEKPFEAVATHDFDKKAYVEILKDDVVAHMKSLSQEPGFKEVLRKSRKADTWTLAYLRRIKLIRDMLEAVQVASGPEAYEEIEPLAYELNKHKKNLIDQVRYETYSTSGSEIATSKSTRTTGGKISTTRGKCETFVNDNFKTGPPSSSPSPPNGSSRSGSGRLVQAGSEP